MSLSIGDRVIVVGPANELHCYDAYSALNCKGKIVDIKYLGVDLLQDWAKKIPTIKPDTQTYRIKMDSDIEYWLFDIHIVLDLDSLPYDEWVKRRDWNKVYKQQSEKVLRG